MDFDTLNLVFDIDDTIKPLRIMRGDSIETATSPVFIQGDHIRLAIALKQTNRASGAYETVILPSGYTLIFSGKHRNLSNQQLLFSATSFASVGDGDDTHYVGDLNLNTVPLSVLPDIQVDVRCELEIQNPDNTRRRTLQFDAVVRRQVYSDEEPPVAADPAYPNPDNLALRNPGAAGNYRIDDGLTLKLKNLVSGEYETIESRLESGIRLRREDGRCAIYVDGVKRGEI